MAEADCGNGCGFHSGPFHDSPMHAEYADARAVIEGQGTLKGIGEFTFKAENIRPERFLTERPLAGLIGMSGESKVTAPRLDAVEGQAKDHSIRGECPWRGGASDSGGRDRFQNQIASLQSFNLEGPETRASAGGTVNLATGSINLDIEADTDLRILEGFIPRSSAFGRIESEAAVRGTTSQPDMRGFVNLADAQIQIDEPSLLLSEVNARIDLNGSRVTNPASHRKPQRGEFHDYRWNRPFFGRSSERRRRGPSDRHNSGLSRRATKRNRRRSEAERIVPGSGSYR